MAVAEGLLEHREHCSPHISSKAASGGNERMESLLSSPFQKKCLPPELVVPSTPSHPLLVPRTIARPVEQDLNVSRAEKRVTLGGERRECGRGRKALGAGEGKGGLLSCPRARRSQIVCFRGTPAPSGWMFHSALSDREITWLEVFCSFPRSGEGVLYVPISNNTPKTVLTLGSPVVLPQLPCDPDSDVCPYVFWNVWSSLLGHSSTPQSYLRSQLKFSLAYDCSFFLGPHMGAHSVSWLW